MTLLRIIYALLGAILTWLIIFAVRSGDFWEAGHWLTSDPWGIVTMVDLYCGLTISAAIIGIFERNWKALFWIIPLPFLGNVWTIVWFVLRLPELTRRLGG